MDIRGRCCPIRDAKQFSMCPARVDTTYFCIMNDCDKYQDIWSSSSREEKHKKLLEYAIAEPFLLKDDPSHSDSVLEEMLFLLFDEDDEEDYESANCEKCCENYLLDKLEVKDEKFYCRVCFEEEDNRECCENCHEKTSCAEWIDYIGNNILYCDECYERHQERIEKKCTICNFRQRCPNKNICSICIDDE
jgi:hypothetical protein